MASFTFVNVSVVVCAYNEEENIERILAPFSDAVVLDNGSTDHTVALAEAMGARVFDTSRRFMLSPTLQDVDSFAERFGYPPSFEVGQSFQDSGARRAWGAGQATYDWCYFPDCDEHLTEFDAEAIEALLPTCDRLTYRFVHAHDEDGNPTVEFANSKLFRKSKTHWEGIAHEVGVPDPDAREVFTTAMRVDHWQRANPDRGIPRLQVIEYMALKQPSARNSYYCGRTYMEHGDAPKAATLLLEATKFPQWRPERSEVYRLLAQCVDNPEMQQAYSYAAISEDPTRRECWTSLGDFYSRGGNEQAARAFYAAALTVPFDPTSFLTDATQFSPAAEERLKATS